jgi:hypothetical protein
VGEQHRRGLLQQRLGALGLALGLLPLVGGLGQGQLSLLQPRLNASAETFAAFERR